MARTEGNIWAAGPRVSGAHVAAVEVIAAGPIRVLLVDDSEDIRLLFRLHLEFDPCFEVWGEAANGEEAIALVATTSPDVIVLDIMMPVMDGLTALPLLRELRPTIPVIIMTSAATPEARHLALGRGACAVIDKCAAIDQLKRALLAACAPTGVESQVAV